MEAKTEWKNKMNKKLLFLLLNGNICALSVTVYRLIDNNIVWSHWNIYIFIHISAFVPIKCDRFCISHLHFESLLQLIRKISGHRLILIENFNFNILSFPVFFFFFFAEWRFVYFDIASSSWRSTKWWITMWTMESNTKCSYDFAIGHFTAERTKHIFTR